MTAVLECERWDLIPDMEACARLAVELVTYDDGVRLRLCREHATESSQLAGDQE